jgi:hypothetical protein
LIINLLAVMPMTADAAKEGSQSNNRSLFTTFIDASQRAGLTTPIVYGGVDQKRFIIETNGCGVAFIDYDNDGWIDILTLSGTRLERSASSARTTNQLYRNRRDGTFLNVAATSGFANEGWASAVTVGDYDNDGYDDLFITYWGQNKLYRNTGKGSFVDVTDRAGLTTKGIRWGAGCSFIDFDRDGDLDLFVANYLKFDLESVPSPGKGANCMWKGVPVNCGPKGLPSDTNLFYRNNGNGTFSDISNESGVAKVRDRYPMTAIVTDFNRDGWADIYVACDSTASILYRNNQDGSFTDVALEMGVAYNEDGQAQAGMGVAIGDYNGDGLPDIFKTHFADDLPALYKNTGRGFFEDASRQAGFDHLRFVQWGTGIVDLDNDSWPDIVIATGNVYPEVEKVFKEYPHRSQRLIYRNLGNGRFKDVTAESGSVMIEPYSSRGCAFGDYDNDGDVDVLVMNMNDRPLLMRNEYTSGSKRGENNWIKVKLEGVKSNRNAIGALVTVWAGSRKQAQEVNSQSSYYSFNDARLHFGLGSASRADRIEVRWPSGEVESAVDVSGNQVVLIKESSRQR